MSQRKSNTFQYWILKKKKNPSLDQQCMYVETYGKWCKICRNPHDTISHVLNGCMEFKLNYIEMHKHNNIANIICEAIRKYHQTVTMYKEKIITVDLISDDNELQITDYFKTVQAMSIDRALKKCFITSRDISPIWCIYRRLLWREVLKVCPSVWTVSIVRIWRRNYCLDCLVHRRSISGVRMLGIPNGVANHWQSMHLLCYDWLSHYLEKTRTIF